MLLIMKNDDFDLSGTKELIRGIHDKLSKDRVIILNNCPIQEYEGEEDIRNRLRTNFDMKVDYVIPHFCDLLRYGSKNLLALDKPEHRFVTYIEEISERIIGEK